MKGQPQMFKRVPVPNFKIDVSVVGPGGFVAGSIKFTCKPMRRQEFRDFLNQADGTDIDNLIADVAIDWDTGEPFTIEALNDILDEFSGTTAEFIRTYTRAIYGAAAKN